MSLQADPRVVLEFSPGGLLITMDRLMGAAGASAFRAASISDRVWAMGRTIPSQWLLGYADGAYQRLAFGDKDYGVNRRRLLETYGALAMTAAAPINALARVKLDQLALSQNYLGLPRWTIPSETMTVLNNEVENELGALSQLETKGLILNLTSITNKGIANAQKSTAAGIRIEMAARLGEIAEVESHLLAANTDLGAAKTALENDTKTVDEMKQVISAHDKQVFEKWKSEQKDQCDKLVWNALAAFGSIAKAVYTLGATTGDLVDNWSKLAEAGTGASSWEKFKGLAGASKPFLESLATQVPHILDAVTQEGPIGFEGSDAFKSEGLIVCNEPWSPAMLYADISRGLGETELAHVVRRIAEDALRVQSASNRLAADALKYKRLTEEAAALETLATQVESTPALVSPDAAMNWICHSGKSTMARALSKAYRASSLYEYLTLDSNRLVSPSRFTSDFNFLDVDNGADGLRAFLAPLKEPPKINVEHMSTQTIDLDGLKFLSGADKKPTRLFSEAEVAKYRSSRIIPFEIRAEDLKAYSVPRFARVDVRLMGHDGKPLADGVELGVEIRRALNDSFVSIGGVKPPSAALATRAFVSTKTVSSAPTLTVEAALAEKMYGWPLAGDWIVDFSKANKKGALDTVGKVLLEIVFTRQ